MRCLNVIVKTFLNAQLEEGRTKTMKPMHSIFPVGLQSALGKIIIEIQLLSQVWMSNLAVGFSQVGILKQKTDRIKKWSTRVTEGEQY